MWRRKRSKPQNWDKIADLLDTWAYCRKGYLRAKGVGEPVQMGDLDRMNPSDLMLWAQATAASEVAMILREPQLAHHHIPANLHPKWKKALAKAME